jgi:hypothetical protein
MHNGNNTALPVGSEAAPGFLRLMIAVVSASIIITGLLVLSLITIS